MKRILAITLLFFLLCGCTQSNQEQENSVFTKTENGNLISAAGVEYSHLANEGVLYYLGELEFVGSIQEEEQTSQHLGLSYQTGMYAIKNSPNDNIFIRYAPNNEWFSIYRKSDLPVSDFSVDNCIRLEFVPGIGNQEKASIHVNCNGGIVDKSKITEFLANIRSQESPREAGLYDFIKQPNGMLENCYVYGVVYGFFKDEPNLAIRMEITSYNDLAYTISIGESEYVLPELWLEELQNSHCTH